MFCTGAWYSRPDPEYYIKLVLDHLGKVGPFTEEIEKDVRRYAFWMVGRKPVNRGE